MLLNLADDINRTRHIEAFAGDAQGLINRRQVGIGKLDVHNRPDNLHYLADTARAFSAVRSSHKISFSPLLSQLVNCVVTAQDGLQPDFGFGFGMIIAWLKPKSGCKPSCAVTTQFTS